MSDLQDYRDYLETRYESLRKQRIPVVGTVEYHRKLTQLHNAKIKHKMSNIKLCLNMLDKYIKKDLEE